MRRLVGDELAHFWTCFDHDYWSTIPAIAGAIAAGYELVCVSAIEAHFAAARLQNLRTAGFPIERVIATANTTLDASPKAAALQELRPVAFVDDFLPYLWGIPTEIHAALVLREPNGCRTRARTLRGHIRDMRIWPALLPGGSAIKTRRSPAEATVGMLLPLMIVFS